MPGRRRDSRAPTPYPRTARVNELLREVVAETLERLADTDERLRLVTVTAVETHPDLRQATVYLSSLPAAAAEALEEQRVALQRTIGRQVRMKRTPLLSFAADLGVAHGSAVEEILRQIRADEPVAPGRAPAPDQPVDDDAPS